MGVSDELLAARWNDGLPVSGGPGLNDLEAAVKLITGIPFSSTITLGLGLTAKCEFAAPIRARGSSTVANYGIRLRDTTNSKEWLVQNIDGAITLYYNTGTEASPTWQFQGQVPIQCICHVNRATADGSSSVGAAGYTVSWARTIREDISSMWAIGAPTRVIIPFAGYYRVSCHGFVSSVLNTMTGWLYNVLYVNGSVVSTSGQRSHAVLGTGKPDASWINTWHANFSASDYIEWKVAAESSISGLDFNMVIERLS